MAYLGHDMVMPNLGCRHMRDFTRQDGPDVSHANLATCRLAVEWPVNDAVALLYADTAGTHLISLMWLSAMVKLTRGADDT